MNLKIRLINIEKKLERIDNEEHLLPEPIVFEDHKGRKIPCRTTNEIAKTLQQIITNEI